MKHRSATARRRRRPRRIMTTVVAILGAVAVAGVVAFYNKSSDPHSPLPVQLPTKPQSYLGAFAHGLPSSTSELTTFDNATGNKVDLVTYYSGWYEPFQRQLADSAAANGEVPLIQLNPGGFNLATIGNSANTAYLSQYAAAVKAYGGPVILSFGHEMNGTWYSWGYKHTPPRVFVAAWRHVVELFRNFGAKNVTWLWTVNIIDDTQVGKIPSPAAWWPGSQYVDWVGVDGYYLKPNWAFAPLFGPTLNVIHHLTTDPIIIGETGVTESAGQPAKLANLFAGVREYGLLGFVYFNANSQSGNFELSSQAAISAFSNGAVSYSKPWS
jgi:mannan endo-1,4-beta-mannosidase